MEEKEPITVSYSQFSKWLECPYRWKLEYVDGHKDRDQSIDTIFGTAMHETIQEWLAVHFTDEKKAKKVDITPIFKKKLISLFTENIRLLESGHREFLASKEILQEYYEDGAAILEHVQKHGHQFFPTKGFELVNCELELNVELKDKLKFIAYLDIVIKETKPNFYHIVDLKTSRGGWYDAQKKDVKKIWQILLYKKFYSELFEVPLENIFPKFIILKRKIKENLVVPYPIIRLSKFEPSHGKISMSKMTEAWESFLKLCFDVEGNYKPKELKPTPSESACRYCPFSNNKKLCPVGIPSKYESKKMSILTETVKSSELENSSQ